MAESGLSGLWDYQHCGPPPPPPRRLSPRIALDATVFGGEPTDNPFASHRGAGQAATGSAGVGSARLTDAALNDVYWDEIAAIEPDGVDDVYDLTVPGYHNFVANDLIVHNSIEQDADVVIFVYREDYYNEDTDRQNIADLMVAKHRHGTTGTVSLFFRKELTQFRDLELRTEELAY